jgi:uncharacterized membrane protein YeaQ/YmgE (transglycosylase-associated protein family)/uncharacterized coiled-coil protein SlyX
MNTKRTSSPRPTVAQLHTEVMNLDTRVGTVEDTVSANAAAQAAVNAELESKIAEMRSVVDQLTAELEAIRANPSLTPPERHRKHTSLSRCINGMLSRLTALEARDASLPGYADAVNAELARMNEVLSQNNIRLTRVEGLEPRVEILDITVMDHSVTLERHTEQIDGLMAQVSAGGQGQGRWLEGAIAGVVVGFIAYFVTNDWADRSHGASLFAAIVIGVAVMLVVASFERRPEQVTAESNAAATANTPAPAPAPADNGDDAGQPPTAPVPVIASATTAAVA